MRPTRPAAALAALFAVLGCAVVLVMTRNGAGVTVDSGEYLAVADGLAHGHGFTMPYAGYDERYPDVVDPSARIAMTQFPPAFPAAVAAGQRLTGAEPTTVARWFNAAALGLTVGVTALLVYAATTSLLLEAIAAALLVRPPLVFAHARLLSEPLALLALAVVIAATHSYLTRPSRRTLILLTAAGAVGALTRLPGVVAVVCAAIALALWSTGDGRRRVLRAVLVATAALAPLVLWFVRNATTTGRASDRTIGFHPAANDEWRGAVAKWLAWVGPHQLPWAIVRLAVVVAIVAWMSSAAWRRRADWLQRVTLARLCAFFAVAYAAFVVAVRTFIDNNLSFGSRMFLPVLLLATIGVAAAAAADTTSRTGRRVVVGVAVAICAWSTGVLVFKNIPDFPSSESAAYASTRWRDSEAIAAIDRLDADTLIVTNAPDAIWLHTRRAPLFIPLERDLFSGGPNLRYDTQLAALAAGVRGHRTAVVFFDYPTRKAYRRQINPKVITVLKLTPVRRVSDGTLYAVGI